jgi:DNA-binding beta-propeller fold protein YncE
MRIVGTEEFVFEEIERWGAFPAGWHIGDAPAVAVDSQDRLYIYSRSEHPVIVLDREGHLLATWGEGLFKRPHGLFIGPDDAVYCVDDEGHAIRKFTTDGNLLLTIETASHPSDTGYTGAPGSVVRSGPPFNFPTGLALSPEGEMYVSDGYGNARVHKFDRDGRLLFSWGEPGSGPGQFIIAHGVFVDVTGRVFVADRFNERIQIFSPQGAYLGQWSGLRYPNNMCLDAGGAMFVAELGQIMQMIDGEKIAVPTAPAGRITVRDRDGAILTAWGAQDPQGAGLYYAPHGLAIDSRGDLYVGGVSHANSGGLAPADQPILQKYVRVTGRTSGRSA